MKIRSSVHVLIQFSTVAILILSNRNFSFGSVFLFAGLGFFLAVWSIWVMRKSVIRAMPDPHPDTKIISNGSYKLIRHRMYASLYLVLIPLVVYSPSVFRIIVLLVFIINQMLKMFYEEKMLMKQFPEYSNFMKKTKRLIPYVF